MEEEAVEGEEGTRQRTELKRRRSKSLDREEKRGRQEPSVD